VNQRLLVVKLKSSLRKFHRRHYDLVNQMTTDIFRLSLLQSRPLLIYKHDTGSTLEDSQKKSEAVNIRADKTLVHKALKRRLKIKPCEPTNNRGNLMCSRRVSSSCSRSDTGIGMLVTDPVSCL
jgi:hypothetical protein